MNHIRYSLLIAIAVATLLQATSAYACRGVHSHRSFLLDDPPVRPPMGAVMLEVQVDSISDEASKDHSVGVEAKIIRILTPAGDAENATPKTIKIQPNGDIQIMCTFWGVTGKPAAVVGYLNWDKEGQLILIPIAYRAKIYRNPEEDGIVTAKNRKSKSKK